ncbi:hypothetical protein [Taibaiella soli]|jgi:hypothetical protein|uniref:Uncharacterized protein n=1 Tax=Taibaiella soli TaxID=1649169 RepID=A0A2W2AV46_9BACT|nr:hypothetical protein [Taibaiella soli]PZF71558.1 hypothetical protein DN068_15905 [Taibaiella soli]
MTKTRITYYPVQFIVLHPLIPVTINTVLPSHIVKITGIKVVHSVGVQNMTTEKYLPVIGHLSLEFNSKQYHFGNIEVPFDYQAEASDEFLDAGIDIQRNSLLTGNYENKVFTGIDYLKADGTVTDKWSNYIVTIYLKTMSND